MAAGVFAVAAAGIVAAAVVVAVAAASGLEEAGLGWRDSCELVGVAGPLQQLGLRLAVLLPLPPRLERGCDCHAIDGCGHWNMKFM